MKITLLNTEKIRFVIIGCINTALDFGILFSLTFLGFNIILSNYLSTGVALIFSFFANRSFTFQSKNSAVKKQLLLFIIITLFGLWVLQPVIIWGVTSYLHQTIVNEALCLFIAKVLATLVSLAWNYTLYSRIVFK